MFRALWRPLSQHFSTVSQAPLQKGSRSKSTIGPPWQCRTEASRSVWSSCPYATKPCNSVPARRRKVTWPLLVDAKQWGGANITDAGVLGVNGASTWQGQSQLVPHSQEAADWRQISLCSYLLHSIHDSIRALLTASSLMYQRLILLRSYLQQWYAQLLLGYPCGFSLDSLIVRAVAPFIRALLYAIGEARANCGVLCIPELSTSHLLCSCSQQWHAQRHLS